MSSKNSTFPVANILKTLLPSFVRPYVKRIYQRFRPPPSPKQYAIDEEWLKDSRDYWLGGYINDPRGLVNSPEKYLDTEYSGKDILIEVFQGFGDFKSVLEIGCAACRNLILLHNEFGIQDIHGVEINPEAINTARANFPEANSWNLFTGDITNQDCLNVFDDNSVDVVFSRSVLRHLPPGRIRQLVINQMLRISSKHVVLIEPFSDVPGENNNPPELGYPSASDNYARYLYGYEYQRKQVGAPGVGVLIINVETGRHP